MKNTATATAKLSSLKAGSNALVKRIAPDNLALLNKLACMGIVAGTRLEVLAIAPLGDPIKIRTLGGLLSLRVAEADRIEIDADAQ
jgi:ferrous iron transport protein A